MENTHIISVPVVGGKGVIPTIESWEDKEKITGISIIPQLADANQIETCMNNTFIEMSHDGDAKFVRANTPASLLYFGNDVGNSERFHKFTVPYTARKKRVSGVITSAFGTDFIAHIVLIYE